MVREPTPGELASIQRGVGAITLRWGRLELTLNLMIALIYHQIGGREIEPELPLMFGRRLRFLRRCFAQIEPLTPYRKEAVELFDLLADLAVVRETISHGGFVGVGEGGALSLQLHYSVLRPTKCKTGHRFEEHTLTMGELFEFGDLADYIALQAVAFSERFAEAVVREEPSA